MSATLTAHLTTDPAKPEPVPRPHNTPTARAANVAIPRQEADDESVALEDVEIRSAVEYPRQPVEWLWPGKIPIGRVTLLVGDPGLGKSLVAIDVAARVTRGRGFPAADLPPSTLPLPPSAHDLPPSALPLPPSAGSVIILSAEDAIADTIRPRLDAHGADPSRVFFLPEIADLRRDRAKLEAALRRIPDCRLIVVDPVNAFVGPSDSHFHTIVRKVLEPLAELAAQRGIAILAVTHFRKNEGAAIYRATGSMGFVAASRCVWTVCRDQADPSRRFLLPVKNNLAPASKGLAYSIDSHAEFDAPVLRWQSQPVPADVEAAFQPRPGLRGPAANERKEACDWLRSLLVHGPRSAWDVHHYGSQMGFSETTLRRALFAIGGHTDKVGFDAGWYWSPPPGSEDPANEFPVVPADTVIFDVAGADSSQDQRQEEPRATDANGAGPREADTIETGPMEADPETWRLRQNTDDFEPCATSGAPQFETEISPAEIAESTNYLNRLLARRKRPDSAKTSKPTPTSLRNTESSLKFHQMLIESIEKRLAAETPPDPIGAPDPPPERARSQIEEEARTS